MFKKLLNVFNSEDGQPEVIRVVHWEDKRVRYYIKALCKYEFISEYFDARGSNFHTGGLDGYLTQKEAEAELPRIRELVKRTRR